MRTILLILALEILFTVEAKSVNQSNDSFIPTKDAEVSNIEGLNIINLENIIIEGGNYQTSDQTIETGNGGTINITNVTFQNCNTSDNQGIIGAEDGGALHIDGVAFVDCTVPTGYGDIFVGTNSVSLSGLVKASVYIDGTNHITDAGVGEISASEASALKVKASESDDNKSKVTILFDPTRDMTLSLIEGSPNLDYYVSGVNGYKLQALDDDSNSVGAALDTESGVSEIEADENAPVEYFNLQGVKVDNPEKGLYIMHQGDKVVKVIL